MRSVLKLKKHVLALAVVCGPSLAFAAGKLDLLGGMFNISAKSTVASAAISGAGSYLLAYRMPIWTKFDLQASYTIIATKTVGGDLAFGPDIGFLFFPMSTAASTIATGESVTVEFTDKIKPYLGASFHQRQYQSTQSTYAGFGASLGLEFNQWRNLSLRSDLRYVLLAGPSSTTADEMCMMLGLTFRIGQ